MLVLLFVYIFLNKTISFRIFFAFKKNDLCKLPRQYNKVERFNKNFVENTFHFNEIEYLDHCTSKDSYNYSNILSIRHVVDNLL